MDLGARHRDLLRHLWHAGPASRSELAARMALRPNTVGEVVAELIDLQVLKEGEATTRRVGRPRIPLEIDADGRRVLGLALTPGRIQALPLDLLGNPCRSPTEGLFEVGIDPESPEDGHPVDLAVELLQGIVGPHLLAIGLTVTGFVEQKTREILFSSVLPGERSTSLEPLWAAAIDTPILVGNNMHAMAARWLMEQNEPEEDVLLVQFGDGSLGAMHLIEGRPSHGSIASANELGHSRFFADTERCYCGHTGCLERIFSTDFLHRLDRANGQEVAESEVLGRRLKTFGPSHRDPSVERLLDYLTMGIANAVNFSRPHRLVLADALSENEAFSNRLAERIRHAVLPALADRLQIDSSAAASSSSAETAAWLALAGLYREGWAWG